MATAANRHSGTGRVGWVEFTEESVGGGTVSGSCQGSSPAPANSSSSLSQAAPSPLRDSFVSLDEKPQVKARYSVCSTASFWSSHSEKSSFSGGTSSCDLTSEEPTNEEAYLRTSNSLDFMEDEDMDTISWSSSIKQTGGQPDLTSDLTPGPAPSPFSAWVTFDEEENVRSSGGPSQMTLDNMDDNCNPTLPPTWSQNGNLPLHLSHPSPDASGTSRVQPLVPNSAPYTKKNPFFDEEFSDIKPSLINPFSAYFKNGQEVKSSVLSNGSQRENPAVSLQVHPFQDFQLSRESALLSSQPQQPSMGEEFLEVYDRPQFAGPNLDQLRSLQISDLDDPAAPVFTGDPADEESKEKDDEEDDASLESPYQPSHMIPQEGWPMLLRIPEKKNIMSSRHWGPIYVRLSDEGLLQLYYERGLDKPFRTLRLDARHEISEHRLQSYDEAGRVHTLVVESVQYREKKRMQPRGAAAVRQPVREQLVKLATTCYHDYLSFRYSLGELLRKLPCGEPGPTSPATTAAAGSEEEVQVEVVDEFYGEVGESEGKAVKQLVMTQVCVRAFLSGSPRCQLGLNDVQVKGKEVVWRHDIIPNTTTRWVRLHDPQLHHEHANELEFLSSRRLVFTPPPRCRFELLRFRTSFAEKTLPFTLRTVASVAGAEVTVQSWLNMSQAFSSNRDVLNILPCENVAVRYPIPELWAKNFRREGVIGEKSLKARFNKGASFGSASTSGSEPAMRVTLGTAKYEQAFGAVVWRVNRLPDKNSALGHPHTFFCRLELGSDREVPHSLQRHLQVEFDMPATSASRCCVRSLSVADRPDVRKWVSYRSHYCYQVPIEQNRDGITEDLVPTDEPAGECKLQ